MGDIMTGSRDRLKQAGVPLVLFCTLICTVLFSSGCATTGQRAPELPPILTQDELLRPYQKLGVIELKRERYGAPDDLSPADINWGHQGLREEAAKMGADAVIFPEVTSERQTYIIFPSSEMKAKGTAIKFR
jgi:hypothetical protein